LIIGISYLVEGSNGTITTGGFNQSASHRFEKQYHSYSSLSPLQDDSQQASDFGPTPRANSGYLLYL